VLLLLFAVLVCSVWPLRELRSFPTFISVIVIWLGLSFYAAYQALFEVRSSVPNRLSKWWLLALPLLVYLGFNLVFGSVFLISGFRVLRVASSAMEKTVLIGDRLVTDRNYYDHHAAARNDLVVVNRQYGQTVKRVIAVGGDTIQAKDRQVIVNGQVADEPFIWHSRPIGTNPEIDTFGPITITVGRYFVMGDNRDVSLDSRSPEFGLIDASTIVGRPLYIFQSPDKARVGKKLN
jgi:signal peptidase I